MKSGGSLALFATLAHCIAIAGSTTPAQAQGSGRAPSCVRLFTEQKLYVEYNTLPTPIAMDAAIACTTDSPITCEKTMRALRDLVKGNADAKKIWSKYIMECKGVLDGAKSVSDGAKTPRSRSGSCVRLYTEYKVYVDFDKQLPTPQAMDAAIACTTDSPDLCKKTMRVLQGLVEDDADAKKIWSKYILECKGR